MTTQPSKVRVAVAGCGAWGSNHLRVLDELGVLALACDPRSERRAEVRRRFPDLEIVNDVDEALGRDDIDAVVLATPAPSHADLAVAGLRAGKHVLVEKPLALSISGARQIEEALSGGDRVLLVGHVLEYHPAVVALQELARSGKLGQIRYVYSNRANLGRVRTEENALWSFAPHDVALTLSLAGDLPTSVSCHGASYLTPGVADVTLTTMEFPGALRAHIFVSWLHPFREQRLVVVGEQSMAVFDDTAPWEGKLMLFPHSVEWQSGRIPVERRSDAVPVVLEPCEPLHLECQHFLECIRDGLEPRTGLDSGMRVVQVLECAGRSLASGGASVAVGPTQTTGSSGGAGPPDDAPFVHPTAADGGIGGAEGYVDDAPFVHPTAADGGIGGAEGYVDDAPFVHPTATVDPGAKVGSGTRVWHYAHVMSGAVIGDDCVLGQNVYVGGTARIGAGVHIQNNVSVYDGVVLEDSVFCGPSVVFTNVKRPRSHLDQKDRYLVTRVGEGATLGANSTIVCGVSIGAYAFVGAGAVVTHDVAPHALVAGVPARPCGWVCRCGEQLKGDGGSCPECGRQWRVGPSGGLEASS